MERTRSKKVQMGQINPSEEKPSSIRGTGQYFSAGDLAAMLNLSTLCAGTPSCHCQPLDHPSIFCSTKIPGWSSEAFPRLWGRFAYGEIDTCDDCLFEFVERSDLSISG
ncbi:hypothetical protein J1614_000988 [Plenodomus biglobosus]|nr:hypothetical protein J1614_000988 [Plenodomus biglobosus]